MVETAWTVAVGLTVGLVIAVLGAPRLGTMLFEVNPLDPASFAAAVVLLIFVAVIATYVPARRAAGADPARSLRAS